MKHRRQNSWEYQNRMWFQVIQLKKKKNQVSWNFVHSWWQTIVRTLFPVMILGIPPEFSAMAYEAKYHRQVSLGKLLYFGCRKVGGCTCEGWWWDSLASWNNLAIKVENVLCVPYVACWAAQSSIAPTDSTKISPTQVPLPCWLSVYRHCSCCRVGSCSPNFWVNQLLPLCQQQQVTKSTGETDAMFSVHRYAQARDENLSSVDVIASWWLLLELKSRLGDQEESSPAPTKLQNTIDFLCSLQFTQQSGP